MPSVRVTSWMLAAALLGWAPVSGCNSRNVTGELSAPKDAQAFESKHRKAFDDDYTDATVALEGRAPNDVLDQRLFAERIGFADVLAVVRVQQVFGKGRYEGRKEQYIAISIEDVLMGTLPKGTEPDQLLIVKGDDELPGDLSNQTLLLFVKWSPDTTPSFHHHLMPAEDELLTNIAAMIQHAQSEGVLNPDGEVSTGRGGRKARKKNKKKGADAPGSDDPPA